MTETYRLLSYHPGTGRPRAGVLIDGQVHDLAEAAGLDPAMADSVMAALEVWDEVRPRIENLIRSIRSGTNPPAGSVGPLSEVRLAAPLLYPGMMYFAGANYRDHLIEMTGESPPPKTGRDPFFFIKTSRASVIGTGEPIRLPPFSSKVDWEAELALVVGWRAKDLPLDRALDCIMGVTIANDLSVRDAPRRTDMPFGTHWIASKCFDGACPMGPWITPLDQIGDPHHLAIRLWVGDELMQNSSTSELVHDLRDQVAYLSHHVTLFPGDVIATGTPAGVGLPRGRFLRSGDRVRIEIEGLGELSNDVL